jgi:ubiquinone/menaquinone biosynthesis C-methylase UbiE
MADQQENHRRLIVEQFTRQAVPFAQMPIHSDQASNRLVLETIGIQPTDTVLDVACGPGLITCAVAEIGRHVTGIDITPAMIEQASQRQRAKRLTNMSWFVGDVQALPFAGGSFSAVITRYSFHHFLEPQVVFQEMVRVCQLGGKVAVVDVFTSSPEQGAAYDRMEKLRDPSHVRALALDELTGMFVAARLQHVRNVFYRLDVGLEELLAATRTESQPADTVRQIFENDLGQDQLGVGAYRQDGQIRFAFPIVIVTGKTPET